MRIITQSLTTCLLSTVLFACSQTATVEEQVVESSHTNPLVDQRAIDTTNKEVMPGDPTYRPIRIDPVETVQVPTGSLFNPQSAVGLYELHRKYRVGDMILIRLDESTSSKKSLDYKRDKSGSLQVGPMTVNAGPIQISEDDFGVEHEHESEFDSSAETSQSNSLEGDITVYVKEILPNDNLVIAGEKWITLNKGQEYVRFSGEVRIKDIEVDNSVSSSKIGNARIEYSGKGDLQDNQDPTLIGKLFSIFD